MSADAAIHEQVGEMVGELLALVEGIVPASARHDLEEGRRRLEEERINLVVLGEFKRGKSTLVNALVETDANPGRNANVPLRNAAEGTTPTTGRPDHATHTSRGSGETCSARPANMPSRRTSW